MLDPTHESNKNLRSPLISYAVSIVMTFVIYFLAVKDYLLLRPMAFVLIALTVVEACVQLTFSFQVLNEDKPRWNLMTLVFTIMVIVIVIGGSVWIMSNVNYDLMPKMSSFSRP